MVVNKLNDAPKYYTHAELRNLEIFELRLLAKKQKSEVLNIIFAYSLQICTTKAEKPICYLGVLIS